MFKKGGIPWNKGKTYKTDKRVARPWLNKKRDKKIREKIGKTQKGMKKPWVIGFKKGHKHSEITKKKLSKAKLGNKNPMKRRDIRLKVSNALKGHKMSNNTKNKLKEINLGHHRKGWKLSKKTRKKMSVARSGNKNHFWKGGITPKNKKIRNGIEYRLWREAVFARDNWTCQKYRIKGGRLVAHHINNFAEKIELRFAIDNGITLSEKAHREFHKKYGKQNNTKEQLKEFLQQQKLGNKEQKL